MQATIFPQGISAIAAPALYADILAVFAPAEANAGEQVPVKVHIKNLYTSRISVKTSAIVFIGTDAVASVVFPTTWLDLDPGISYQFEGTFTMPNANVRLHAVSYWYGGGTWHIDETMDVYITLAGGLLAEFSRVRYWDASTGQYVSEPPTVQIGSVAGADFIVENVSGQSLDIGLFVEAFDPFGNSIGAKLMGPGLLAPGSTFGGWYKITTEFPGTYTFTVDIITSPLIPYGIIGTLGNIPIAYVVGEIPPLAGHVYDPMVYDTTTGDVFYSAELPAGIDGGHKVIVGIHWMNDGGETATFNPTFELIDPDGISREIQTFTTVLSPTEGTGGQTGSSVELDKVGTWKIHATLEADGTLVDEETWNAITVTVLPPPEYAGTITAITISKGKDSMEPLPFTVVADNQTFEVGFRGVNTSPDDIVCGPEIKVYDPDYVLRASPDIDWAGIAPGKEYIWGNRNICAVDKAGTWTVMVRFLEKTTSTVLDRQEGLMLAVSEVYAGTISKKQLTYDSVVGLIPVGAKVSQGTSGIVTVLGRNDMDTTQQMGIIWRVFDPDGFEVEYYSAWEAWPYCPPGDEHKFDGGRFDLDKSGVWTIEIDLYMNHDDPVIVNWYEGTLCTVEAIEYAGTISKKQFKYDSVVGDIPVAAEVSQGMDGIVTAWGRNDMAVQQQLGMRWEVRDPDGYVVEQYPGGGAINWEYGYTGPGDEQDFIGGRFDLNKLGDWTIHIELFMNPDDPVMVDPYDGLLCTVVPAFPEPEFQNFAITGYDGVPVDEQLMVIPGQTVTVHMTVDYRGPAIDGSIYTAIGWKGIYFLPTFSSKTPVHFDASYDFHPDNPYEIDCDVDILTLPPAEELLYGTLLDMYAKIVEVPGPDIYTPFYIGVIAWSKPPEEYELIQHTIHHFAYIYDGDDKTTIVTLKTDPFKPADWVPEKFISELEREARENGVHVLETKVYVDTSPLFWTDYKIEITGTPPPSAEGVGFGGLPAIPLFVKIILTALAIAFGIFIVSWAVKEYFLGIFQHKPGLEDMKPTWGKEALKLDIQDTEGWLKKEGRLERPVTPTETLEGMSEEELRDLLDELGKKVVPPVPDWVKYAIIGGLGVLGVVAILALAPKKKE